MNSIFLDPCSGENVQFTGSETVSGSFFTTSNNFHDTIHLIAKADGVGLSTGASYNLNYETTIEENGAFNFFPFETDFATNERVVGQGGRERLNQGSFFTSPSTPMGPLQA